MPLFLLIGASQENAETGKRYNFLMEEDYRQCYMKQNKDKESREKVFKQVISRAAMHHACPDSTYSYKCIIQS